MPSSIAFMLAVTPFVTLGARLLWMARVSA
jgi:hypothetical protein